MQETTSKNFEGQRSQYRDYGASQLFAERKCVRWRTAHNNALAPLKGPIHLRVWLASLARRA
ncbi:hypothetical protein J6590_107449 [Homalodisca vitripennis]|nr:hypothetical protein J6590_107449 [Homalodisca vitripennis]